LEKKFLKELIHEQSQSIEAELPGLAGRVFPAWAPPEPADWVIE